MGQSSQVRRAASARIDSRTAGRLDPPCPLCRFFPIAHNTVRRNLGFHAGAVAPKVTTEEETDCRVTLVSVFVDHLSQFYPCKFLLIYSIALITIDDYIMLRRS
jgi:hypothetical protein